MLLILLIAMGITVPYTSRFDVLSSAIFYASIKPKIQTLFDRVR